ncbi:MAG: hypothetical protein J0G32_07035, partial [Alphaproteobacteria bacterium]|nr:hypothetical protein [Alphaproteobacteria bacterium]
SYAEKSDAYLINFYNSAKDAYRKNNLAVLEDAYKFFKTKFPKLNISRKISNMMHEVKARSLYSNNQLTEASKYLDGFAISSDTAALGILQAEIELELKNRIKALNILAEVWEHKPSYEVFSLILTAMEMDSNIQRAKKLQDFFEEVNQNKNIGLLVSVSFLLDENLIEPAEKIFEHTKDDGTKIYNYVKSYMFIAQQNALGAGKILSKLIKEI